MTLPIKKIYIDTRFKTADSNSNSDFKIQLKSSYALPRNSVFYIEDFVASHAFYAVEQGINNKFYFKLNSNFYVVTIPPSNYNGTTLASTLQSLINTVTTLTFSVVFSINQNNLTITPPAGYNLFVLTDSDILNSQGVSSPGSTNDILNNGEATASYYTNINPYVSGSLNLLCFRNLYLSSNNLSSFTTLGARGESNIIKKIPVTSDYGYLIVDSFTSNHDWLDCSNTVLSNLEFQLKDVKGNLIPLHGSHVSFSIVFSKVNSELA